MKKYLTEFIGTFFLVFTIGMTVIAPGIGGHTLKFLEHAFAGMERVDHCQFEHAMMLHFDQMDTNRDGVLSVAERNAASATQMSSR